MAAIHVTAHLEKMVKQTSTQTGTICSQSLKSPRVRIFAWAAVTLVQHLRYQIREKSKHIIFLEAYIY